MNYYCYHNNNNNDNNSDNIAESIVNIPDMDFQLKM